MKNKSKEDDLLPEYDFSKSVPGRHRGRVSRDAKVTFRKDDGSPAPRPSASTRAAFKAAKHK